MARRTPAHASRARILRRILSVYGHMGFTTRPPEIWPGGQISGGLAYRILEYNIYELLNLVDLIVP